MSKLYYRIVIKTLKKLLKEKLNELDLANLKIKERQKMIDQYQEENEILLMNASELRSKIVDLENNIEVLYNSLPKNKRELARPANQD